MAEKTSTFTVNNTGDPEAVIATIQCREIRIMEDPAVAGWPTTDFLIYNPTIGATPARRLVGTSYVFVQSHDRGQPRLFNPNETVGFVATVTGSTTFQMIEVY